MMIEPTHPIADVAVGSVPASDLAAGLPVPLVACTLDLPYDRPPDPLSANSRAHWRPRGAATRMVRRDVEALARAAGLHCVTGIRHVTVQLVWAPGDRRRRDEDNLYPLLKVCCDALARGPRRDWIGLELVPDDTPEHMTKLAPRIDPPPAPRGLRLEIVLDLDEPGRPDSESELP